MVVGPRVSDNSAQGAFSEHDLVAQLPRNGFGMTARLTILASGSAGNSALVEIDGARLLVDVGLEPADLLDRMQSCGCDWRDLSGVLLTHRHTDHWRPATIKKLAEHRVPLFAHRDHIAALRVGCRGFDEIERSKLARPYVTNRPIMLADSWTCRPFRVRHDGGATFGFRFEGQPFSAKQTDAAPHALTIGRWAFAYVADLGCWEDDVVAALRDVDLLALEFNHDPAMLKASRRPPWLISRVLGDDGHLSNAQAANLLRNVLRQSTTPRLRQVVLLHLSRECNTPQLAAAAAEAVLVEHDSSASVFFAEQHRPSPTFIIGETSLRNVACGAGQLQQLALF